MALFKKKQRADPEAEKLKSFLDMIAPSLVKFEFDRYFCGNSIRCVWALREYPTATDDQAILRHLGEMHGVTGIAAFRYDHHKCPSDCRSASLGFILI